MLFGLHVDAADVSTDWLAKHGQAGREHQKPCETNLTHRGRASRTPHLLSCASGEDDANRAELKGGEVRLGRPEWLVASRTSDLDSVPVEVGHVRVGNPRGMLAPVEKPASGLPDAANRLVD